LADPSCTQSTGSEAKNRHYTNNRDMPPDVSAIQINPNREQLRAEEADGGGIAGAPRQLIREPALARAGIIIEKQSGGAAIPASPQPVAQFHAHPRTDHNIANVAGLLAVLCHDPKLSTHESVAHGGAAWFPAVATGRFQESVSRWGKANRKQKLNGRIEEIFLEKVD
jgi:hypothetical protein